MIAEVMDLKDISANNREGIMVVLMMKLANESPPTVLRLLPGIFETVQDMEDSKVFRDQLLTTSLINWSKQDVRAVVGWLRDNEANFPGSITESDRCGIVSGAASQNPDSAFRLIDELQIKEKGQAIQGIVSSAKTPEERSAVLVPAFAYWKSH